jgi:sugar phosphate isomerase/epimerase
MSTGGWPVAVATHAARDSIGPAPGDLTVSPGMLPFLAWAADAGFDGIDLSDTVVPFDRGARGLQRLASAASDYGLQFAALNLLRASLADPHYGSESLDRARRAIDACAELGAAVLSISLALPRQVDDCNRFRGLQQSLGSSRVGSDRDFEMTAERLQVLAGEARPVGVQLSIELHHASLADSAAATLRLHRLAADPAIGVNPDLVNAYWAYCTPEEDWKEQLVMLAPHANIWHVKNVHRVETMPGAHAFYVGTNLAEGDLDYRWACRIMRKAQFSGWVSIERGGPGDALHTLRVSLDYLKNDLMNESAFEGDEQNAF